VTKPTRPSLTERRAEELRLSIALAARDLFIADGDTSATVERICGVVGIAPRTFHRHFPVKEDVVLPLFTQFGSKSIDVLEQASEGADLVETLVEALTFQVRQRGAGESDRTLMTLIINDLQYRSRWLEWGDHLVEPITELLGRRLELGSHPVLATLPAQLIVHTGRQAYTRWIETGDLAELEACHRIGIGIILAGVVAKGSSLSSPLSGSPGSETGAQSKYKAG
jgi:AcrR family transcriptional regulator